MDDSPCQEKYDSTYGLINNSGLPPRRNACRSASRVVGDRFAAIGAKLEFVIGSPQDNMAKVLAARDHGDPPMDAFEVLGTMVPQVLVLKLLADLDTT
jgi:hypothetical protein